MSADPVPATMHAQVAENPREDTLAEVLGAPGGPMDGGYAQVSNVEMPAGYTYFAQFVFHDLTMGMRPRLDLATIYGDGPEAQPQLYDAERPWRLRTGTVLAGEACDLPRGSDGRALVADPRNDRCVMTSRIHASFVQMHNMLADRSRSPSWRSRYHDARLALVSLYKQLVLYDLVPRLSCLDDPFTVRFTGAAEVEMLRAFRFAVGHVGHALVKPRYRINEEIQTVLFVDSNHVGAYADLRGQPLDARGLMEWDNFFPTGSPIVVQHASRMDTRICAPMFFAPTQMGRTVSIPRLTLSMASKVALSDGPTLAKIAGCSAVQKENIWKNDQFDRLDPPAWIYVLGEADNQQHGSRLGQLGSVILENTIALALAESKEGGSISSRRRPGPTGEVGDVLKALEPENKLTRYRQEKPRTYLN